MKTNNFSALYSFKTKEGKDSEFIKAWSGLTKYIYEFEGSYGSRLHKAGPNLFIAYAQWPSKEVWKNSGSNLSETANNFSCQLRECCLELKTEYEMDLVEDLLKSETVDNSKR